MHHANDIQIEYISYKTNSTIIYNSIGPSFITFYKSKSKFETADFYRIEYDWTKLKNCSYMFHRLDGPAVVNYYSDFEAYSYYVDGIQYKKNEDYHLAVIEYTLNISYDAARELKKVLEKEI
jgi:hypothetical protein